LTARYSIATKTSQNSKVIGSNGIWMFFIKDT